MFLQHINLVVTALNLEITSLEKAPLRPQNPFGSQSGSLWLMLYINCTSHKNGKYPQVWMIVFWSIHSKKRLFNALVSGWGSIRSEGLHTFKTCTELITVLSAWGVVCIIMLTHHKDGKQMVRDGKTFLGYGVRCIVNVSILAFI